MGRAFCDVVGTSVGIGVRVGDGVGAYAGVGVVVGDDVGVCVGVGVVVAVDVGVQVCVGVGVGVRVGVGAANPQHPVVSNDSSDNSGMIIRVRCPGDILPLLETCVSSASAFRTF
jgi:hypothetical protein